VSNAANITTLVLTSQSFTTYKYDITIIMHNVCEDENINGVHGDIAFIGRVYTNWW